MDTITIYVTSFAPAGNDGGGGGFFWHRDKDAATRAYTEQARESVREKGSHIVRLVPLTLPNLMDEQITDMIEHDHMNDIEGGAPALRQYVPAHAEPLFIPTGGIIRKGRTMNDHAEWLTITTNRSQRKVAATIGVDSAQLNRELARGLDADRVIQIATAYYADPVQALRDTGHLPTLPKPLTMHVPAALVEDAEQILGAINATVFYRQAGDEFEALIVSDEEYMVSITLDETGKTFTSSKEVGGEWETGVDI